MNMEEQWKSFLSRHVVFSLLGEEALSRLVQHLEMVSFGMGEIILSEGEPGDCAYLIYSGKVRIFQQGREGKPIVLGTLSAGDLFGEFALLHHKPRSASVRAAEDVVLLRIGQADFDRVFLDHPELATYLDRLMRQRAASNFLRLATFLGVLPARQMIALLDRLEECRFQGGETIVRQGDAGDHMYILKAGEARVVRGETEVLAYLGEGDYFGERALILGEPRYASVVAVGVVDALRLSREAFDSLLPTAPQLQEQLRLRLEQYQRTANLGDRCEAPLLATAPTEPVADLKWEEIGDQPEPTRPRPRHGWRSWLPGRSRFPFLAQEDETDCGAAALAMIARYHGHRLSVPRVRDLAHVGATGASMLGLAHAAATVGFEWRAVTTDFAHLAGLSLPAVAHWKGYHYLVVYQVRAQTVVVGDPAVGLVQMSRRNFEAGWTGKLLLLTPTERLRSHPPPATALQALRSLLPIHAPALGALLLSTLLLALLPLAWPLLTHLLVDGVLVPRDASLLVPLLAGFVAVGAMLAAAGTMRHGILDGLAPRINGRLSERWFTRLMKLPLAYFHSRPMGSFLVRLAGNQKSEQAGQLLLTALADLLLVAGALAMLFCYQPSLGWIAFLGMAGLMAGVLFFVRVWQEQQQVWLHETAAQSALVESIQAQATIKQAAAEQDACRKFAIAANAESGATRWRPATLWGLTAAGILLINALVLWYGSAQVVGGEMTLGQLVACQMLVLLATRPMLAWTQRWPQVGALLYHLKKLEDVQETPAEQDQPATSLPPLRGLIKFDDVSFRYHPESPKVLSGIKLTLQPGQVVALIGRSGAGKSTLAMMLGRFLSPTSGVLQIDGVDLASVELKSLRSQVAIVGTEPALFAGTIRDNIALAETDATLARVIDAAKLAGAHDFIMALPCGYDSVIGPGGVRLSDGQNLRLCLARAFLKEPRILILDDVLPFLDAETEPILIKHLRAGARGRTTLLISRRPLPAAYVDVIVVMDAGQIVETGTHRSLVERRGLYHHWTGMDGAG